MELDKDVERLTGILLSGDRAAARIFVDDTLKEGIDAQAFLKDVGGRDCGSDRSRVPAGSGKRGSLFPLPYDCCDSLRQESPSTLRSSRQNTVQ